VWVRNPKLEGSADMLVMEDVWGRDSR